ncbi:sigma-54-dependent transcriptional regulator [Aromatoleum diolicum]|uniref:Response regulator n=1 Tax=Aromatoleum diolicum TaxID=75796 RepID=A0ABX1QIW4_9RHOO|nr:sigma-54 dependent transcriptional regulator [Aromatoleum diolicum]NMG77219.1 response regulator [Aromatoleum diolicum]
MTAPARILVVDDTPANVRLIADLLAVHGYEILTADCGNDGLEKARATVPDLVLLDVMMPDMDGFAVCERLKAAPATRELPIIFLTALNETTDKVRAFSAGGVDYVTKPFEPRELLARVGAHVALRQAGIELERQNRRLREEIEAHQRARASIEALSEEIRVDQNAGGIIGNAPSLRRLLDVLELVAATDSTVLILGETGSGKELVARAIHERSRRRDRPLVKLNCAAMPRELVESELFGHEKGAFTGATQQRRGRFEMADGGTLFLDEVGELPLEAQAKLLRVLQDQQFERVGGTVTLSTHVRVIAATNRNLEAEATAGCFRSDLFYRLNVFPVQLPPLRARREDIPPLISHFATRAGRRLGKHIENASPAFLERALSYSWPGNVRELENFIERAAILARGPWLDAVELFPSALSGAPAATTEAPPATRAQTLEQVEKDHILAVLAHVGGVIEGERGAARILGLNPSTLRGRMRKFGLHKVS